MQHSDAYWKMRRKMAKDLGYQIDKIQAEKKSSKMESTLRLSNISML